MKPVILLDTGPLVALLNRRDTHHLWAKTRLAEVAPPLLTCEAVLSEACFLLRATPAGGRAVLDLARRGLLGLPFHLSEELPAVNKLLWRYANVPMSLADACLVRMAEKHPGGTVLTTDGDFHIYRKNGRHAIPMIAPETE